MLQKDYDMEVNYNCDDFTEAYVQDQKSILLQLKIRGILKLTYEKSTLSGHPYLTSLKQQLNFRKSWQLNKRYDN